MSKSFAVLLYIAMLLLVVLLSLPTFVRSSVGCGNLFFEFWFLYLAGTAAFILLFVRYYPDTDKIMAENLDKVTEGSDGDKG